MNEYSKDLDPDDCWIESRSLLTSICILSQLWAFYILINIMEMVIVLVGTPTKLKS